MDSKRLLILLTIFTLIICVLMDQGGAFDRPTRRRPRSRSCSRRLKGCSRRRSWSGTKADDIKPIDINAVSTILVSDQFPKPVKNSLNALPKLNKRRERTEKKKKKKKKTRKRKRR